MANPEYAARDADLLARSLQVLTNELNQAYDDLRTLRKALDDIEAAAFGGFEDHSARLQTIRHVCRTPAVRAAGTNA